MKKRVQAAGPAVLPIILSGNCNTGVVGSLAAHDSEDVGLFWFDAHSDAETPETSTSGFLDGMGLAIALGCCFRPLLAGLDWAGHSGPRAALVGAREVSASARELLIREGVMIVSPETASVKEPSEALGPAFKQLRSADVTRVHVHIDLDVLDPVLVGRANGYALEGGLTLAQLTRLLSAILAEFDLASASVASYDPAYDERGTVAAAGVEVIALLAAAGLAGESRRPNPR